MPSPAAAPRIEYEITAPVVPFYHTRRDLLTRRILRGQLRRRGRIALLVVVDLLAVAAAGLIASEMWGTTPTDSLMRWRAFPAIAFMALMSLAAFGSYGEGKRWRNLSNAAGAGVTAGIGLALAGTADPWVEMNLAFAAGLSAFLVFFVVLSRLTIKSAVKHAYRRGIGRARVVVIGTLAENEMVAERLVKEDHNHLLGFVSPGFNPEPGALGGLLELSRLIEEHDVRQVVISAHLDTIDFREVAFQCLSHGVALSVVPGVLNEIPCRLTSRDVDGWPLLELQVPRLHMVQIILKRWIDVAVSLVLIALLLPVFIAIAVVIRRQSPGPVFFRQMRPGLGGRTFGMLKFRTMRADAEEVLRRNPELFQRFLDNDCKLPEGEDPRVFAAGSFLRKTSLDELPQLINVLRGDMSLVGPRPVVGPELRHYGAFTHNVLGVRPGITGLWQVNGRSRVAFPHRARIDVDYIVNWSLLHDLKLLLQTIPAVFKRRGAH